ncbi:MAG: DUF1835 domain-containing protein [Gammaproteobacteria bacterium]|nr:DUF1835 domain-containing protein [Gammaproteobacteria bacterium]
MNFTNKTLHITNGDCALNLMQEAGIPGTIIAWRDVLHEGPVPFGMSLPELSEVRAKFIASRGWEEAQDVRTAFKERDERIANFRDYDQLVLWFEHDLYDQLQIIQILSYLATQDLHKFPINMICTEAYLGMQSPEGIKALVSDIEPVSFEMITVATTAWQVFTLNTPLEWYNLLQTNTESLPFLKDAIIRLLQEYPDLKTGLTHTQYNALLLVHEAGGITADKLFNAFQQIEERRFMGDIVFWSYIAQMLEGEDALLALPQGQSLALPVDGNLRFTITEKGEALLAGNFHWPLAGTQDRWIGGVHLKPDDCWFWDSEKSVLVHHKV